MATEQQNKKKKKNNNKALEKLIGELVDIEHDIESEEEIRFRLENELDQQIMKLALLTHKRFEKRREITELEEEEGNGK